MQNMPTGAFVRRKAEENFEPTQSQKYGIKATEWLESEARRIGVHRAYPTQIQWKGKTGRGTKHSRGRFLSRDSNRLPISWLLLAWTQLLPQQKRL